MIDRRMAFLAIVLLLASPVLAADDPAAPIVAIYRIVSAGDGTVGGYVITRKKSRHRWLSRSFAALWDKSDALTPKGDENLPGADPITDSQDPKVRDPQVVIFVKKDPEADYDIVIKVTPGATPMRARIVKIVQTHAE